MDNQEALKISEEKSSTQSLTTTKSTDEVISTSQASLSPEQELESRLKVRQILGIQQLKNAVKLLDGEMSSIFTKDSYGNVATKIEIIIPDED